MNVNATFQLNVSGNKDVVSSYLSSQTLKRVEGPQVKNHPPLDR